MKKEHLKIFQNLNEFDLLTVLMLGEGRGEPIEGRIAIGNVVKNRVKSRKWDGTTYWEVILMPKQFSCFDDSNVDYMIEILGKPNDPLRKETLWIAHGIHGRFILDNTKGAFNYHAGWLNPYPSWAKNMVKTVQIGNHIFYKDK